jgi:chromosome segregation ATPase
LRLANGLIARFATKEADWRHAPSLEYEHWRREINELVKSLAFMIASADAYGTQRSGLAPQIEQLSSDIGEIEQKLGALRERKASLEENLTSLRENLGCAEADGVELRREVDLLQRLQELVPFRAALRERIGVQRLHALANAELAREQGVEHERIEKVLAEVELGLGALDEFLRSNLGLNEGEWEAVRLSLTQQAS